MDTEKPDQGINWLPRVFRPGERLSLARYASEEEAQRSNITINVSVQNDMLVLSMERPVSWMAFNAEEATGFIDVLVASLNRLRDKLRKQQPDESTD
jgi:hypothetical protein